MRGGKRDENYRLEMLEGAKSIGAGAATIASAGAAPRPVLDLNKIPEPGAELLSAANRAALTELAAKNEALSAAEERAVRALRAVRAAEDEALLAAADRAERAVQAAADQTERAEQAAAESASHSASGNANAHALMQSADQALQSAGRAVDNMESARLMSKARDRQRLESETENGQTQALPQEIPILQDRNSALIDTNSYLMALLDASDQ